MSKVRVLDKQLWKRKESSGNRQSGWSSGVGKAGCDLTFGLKSFPQHRGAISGKLATIRKGYSHILVHSIVAGRSLSMPRGLLLLLKISERACQDWARCGLSARQHGVEPIKAELRILKSGHVARRQKKKKSRKSIMIPLSLSAMVRRWTVPLRLMCLSIWSPVNGDGLGGVVEPLGWVVSLTKMSQWVIEPGPVSCPVLCFLIFSQVTSWCCNMLLPV